MKKLLSLLVSVLLCVCMLAPCATVFAEEDEAQTPVNSSVPRFMLTSYSIDGGYVSPSEQKELSLTLKNYSRDKAIYNVKLSLTDDSAEIQPDGTGTAFVQKINAGASYTWKFKIGATPTASVGNHKLTVSSEYEDEYHSAFSNSDTVIVGVKQKTELSYDGIVLASRLTQDSSSSMNAVLMNTGKSVIRNAKVSLDVEGVTTGGVLFIGEVPVGESKSGTINFMVDSSAEGEIKGTATITYENDFGEEFSQTVELTSNVEPKKEETEQEQEKQPKFRLWWAFMLGGLVIGGAVGAIIPISINSYKRRKEDELRL